MEYALLAVGIGVYLLKKAQPNLHGKTYTPPPAIGGAGIKNDLLVSYGNNIMGQGLFKQNNNAQYVYSTKIDANNQLLPPQY